MEFFVNLIKIKSAKTEEALESLFTNCSHVYKMYWLMEGDTEVLEDNGVDFELIDSDLIVPSLVDMSQSDIKEMIMGMGFDIKNF